MFARFFISLVLLSAFTALTADATDMPPLLGVWRGTINHDPVMVCFNKINATKFVNGGRGYFAGKFYSIRLRQGSHLGTEKDNIHYGHYYEVRSREDYKTQWELSAPVNGTIVGVSGNGTKLNRPINLTLVDGGDDESACDLDSFNAPLKSTQGVWRGTIGKKPIYACFNNENVSNLVSDGYYFHDAPYPKSISLRRIKQQPYLYVEPDEQSEHYGYTWQFDLSAPSHGNILGTYRNTKTGENLTIKLTLVDGTDSENACNRDSYKIPLTARMKSPQGVWSGTIGTKPVIACFNDKNGSEGSYYYTSHLEPIHLIKSKNTESYWDEHEPNNDKKNKWELSAPANNTMTGVWHGKAGKTLPIRLALIDGNDDERACALDSYNLRLEENISKFKVEKGKNIQFSPERSYRELRFAGQVTIELFGPEPALSRINSQLKPDQSKEALDAYFQNRRDRLGWYGYFQDDEMSVEPVYWDSNFITVNFYLWTFGMGVSGISNEYRTWSAKTGEPIDFWRWFGVNTNYSGYSDLPPKLENFLYKNVKVDPECEDIVNGGLRGSYWITPEKEGLRITGGGWKHMCEDSFLVPYEKLYPFLSPAGKDAVNSIRGKRNPRAQ